MSCNADHACQRAANLFMLGLSYQRGLIPIGEAAINRAIELNGVAIAANKRGVRMGTPRSC
jgi:indolepyruvate ferredoxin oxidoreductase